MKKLFLPSLPLRVCSAPLLQTQDWANFGRFEQANGQVRNPKVVLMGNSITELWIKTHPDFFAARGYVSRGISGQTTSQMLVRFRADVLDLHPQVVVICGGTNDIAQNTGYISLPHILGNLVSMVELARANGIAPVLCSLLPAREFGWRKELEPAPLIIELNAMIREYARRENVPLCGLPRGDVRSGRRHGSGLYLRRSPSHGRGVRRDGADSAARRRRGAEESETVSAALIAGRGRIIRGPGNAYFPGPLILAGRSQRPSVI